MKKTAASLLIALTVSAGLAFAHGPTRKKVSLDQAIAASPEAVWVVVGNFQDMSYGFSSGGKDRESFTDRVVVKVSRVEEDGRRDMEFDFLTGERHLDFHPATAYRGNPVSIHFLERDISELAKETGGDIAYFRNRVRRAFTHPETRPAKIPLDGKELDGVSVSVTPFVDDPNKERFPTYANKRYDFLFSEQVPGGLYRIRTTVPGASGQGPAIEEDLTFRRETPAG